MSILCRIWFRSAYSTVLLSIVMLLDCTNPSRHKDQKDEGSKIEMFSKSEAYERFMGRWSKQLAPLFLDFVDLKNGDRVLDVGCGTGALSSAVMSVIDPDQVIGIDPSAEYIDYARSKSSDSRLKFETGDGQQLRFPDDYFDATISLLVINFIPDPDKAINEMIRITRPGGIIAAAVWDYNDGMEMLRTFWDEVIIMNPSDEGHDERHMPFSRAGELADIWKTHGLINVREEPLVIQMTFQSFEDFWSPFLEGQGPAGAYVASLSGETKNELKEHLKSHLKARNNGTIRLSGRAWAVRGIVSE